MEHKDTQKYDSDTMKMPKKEKEKKKICGDMQKSRANHSKWRRAD